jgi:hypothetical protein
MDELAHICIPRLGDGLCAVAAVLTYIACTKALPSRDTLRDALQTAHVEKLDEFIDKFDEADVEFVFDNLPVDATTYFNCLIQREEPATAASITRKYLHNEQRIAVFRRIIAYHTAHIEYYPGTYTPRMIHPDLLLQHSGNIRACIVHSCNSHYACHAEIHHTWYDFDTLLPCPKCSDSYLPMIVDSAACTSSSLLSCYTTPS